MTYYEVSIIFAVIGVVLERLQRPEEILSFIPRIIPDGVFKRLISCGKCLAGQLSFWTLFVIGIAIGLPFPYYVFSLISVFLSIFFAIVISLILEKIEYG